MNAYEYFVNAALGDNSSVVWMASLYENVLHRTPDAAGLASNVASLLNVYAAQRQAEVTALVVGGEYRPDLVKGWYLKYLGRPADSDGLNKTVAALQNGSTDEQIIAGLIGSGEFFAKSGGTNLSFLKAAYMDILGRAVDAGAQSSWLAQLSAGTSRYTVALSLLTSMEYRAKAVSGFYTSLLGRNVAGSELSGWLSAFANGATDEQVITALLTSTEYFLRPHVYP